MKRKLIQYLSSLLARLRRNQLVQTRSTAVNKVNIGCGLTVAPGWLNLDASLNAWVANRPHWVRRLSYRLSGARRFYSESTYCKTLVNNHFVFHDVKYGLPFGDQTIDFIFCSHFLEHLAKDNALAFLAECRRVLKKPSGVLRIAVPDLEYAWQLYRQGKKALMLHDFFFTGSDTDFSQHRYAYDFELLSRALSEARFQDIQRVAFREGLTPDIDILDNRPEYTLFVEARPNHP
jgi:Methyltransferase domain